MNINRILVVGNKKVDSRNPNLVSRAWNNLGSLPDIPDFDVVVINLLSLPADEHNVDWLSFLAKFTSNSALKVLGPGGQIVIIGDPSREVSVRDSGGNSRQSFLHWTGFEFNIHSESGSNITKGVGSQRDFLSRYVSRLRNYKWAFHSATHSEAISRRKWEDGDNKLVLAPDPIAQNRVGFPVAVSLRLELHVAHYGHHNFEWRRESQCGSIWLLPEIDADEDETVRIVLQDVLGVHQNSKEPDWATDITAPGEASVISSLHDIDTQIEKLQAERRAVTAARSEIRGPIRLLYDTDDGLEDAVLNALQDLGAQITKPSVRGEEDGWAESSPNGEGYFFALEVKGFSVDNFREDGLKQLPGWVHKGVDEFDRETKGLLIGNTARAKPLGTRPFPFSDSFKRKAERMNFAVLRTEDLYKAYCLNYEGKLDRGLFWKLLWTSTGIVDLRGALENKEILT